MNKLNKFEKFEKIEIIEKFGKKIEIIEKLDEIEQIGKFEKISMSGLPLDGQRCRLRQFDGRYAAIQTRNARHQLHRLPGLERHR